MSAQAAPGTRDYLFVMNNQMDKGRESARSAKLGAATYSEWRTAGERIASAAGETNKELYDCGRGRTPGTGNAKVGVAFGVLSERGTYLQAEIAGEVYEASTASYTTELVGSAARGDTGWSWKPHRDPWSKPAKPEASMQGPGEYVKQLSYARVNPVKYLSVNLLSYQGFQQYLYHRSIPRVILLLYL
ncbi:unnamed protein product [Symbiodinium sp. CCMP2592]|nr:unnamed protein product [Symbiodinium sp. CCMP2592]